MEEIYAITVKGHIDPDWSEWFDGLAIMHMRNGETRLSGPIIDQAALYGILNKVRDLGLPLTSLRRIEDNANEASPSYTPERP